MEILIQVGVGQTRVALVADGKLQEFFQQRTIGDDNALTGEIVLGRVQRVMPGMQAAFVDIGMARSGFLALRDAKGLAKPSDNITISDCVREGEAVLVQVIKDPIGEKGARLSAAVGLPGRLLVMIPGQDGILFSRRIEAAQRAVLGMSGQKLLPQFPGAGFIFRAAAVGASLEEVVQDASRLRAIWRGIEEKRKTARVPATLYHDLGLIERMLRDHVHGEVTSVLLDDAIAAEAARAYCRRAMPTAESLILLSREAVFSHALEEEIAGLAARKVPLKSGAWITIEATEGLTAIDINSGGFTQSGGLEETSLAVNLEAAAEIGRQIRLRGIGGLIVVDFIQLTESAHAQKIVAVLEQSLSFDRTPVQISPMSDFGIVAITRKRVREPLARATQAPCPVCGGMGHQDSPGSVALALLRRVEREARAAPGREILAGAAPEVAAWLNAHWDEIGPELARRGAGRVRFVAGDFQREAFDVRAV